MGWNCRHSFYPFYEGISENAYSKSDLDAYERKRVTYNGQQMSVYDASQIQRGIERKIRYYKRQKEALETINLDASEETNKIKYWQAEMRRFVDETKLQRQSERERIVSIPSIPGPVKKINFKSSEYQNIAELGDIRNCFPDTDPGKIYITPKPVIYNGYAAHHLSDADHRKRLDWLEKNEDGLRKAIQTPDFIEKKIRARKDGYYSLDPHF